MADARRTLPVLGTPIDVIDMAQAVQRIAGWAADAQSRVVCLCNAHSVVTAQRDPAFGDALAQADLAAPGGAPVAWMLRRQGASTPPRVGGPASLPGVTCEVMQPCNTWEDPKAYDPQARDLARRLTLYFQQFEQDVTREVKAAGPRSDALS